MNTYWLANLERDHLALREVTGKKEAIQLLETLLEVLFPGYGNPHIQGLPELEEAFSGLKKNLVELLSDSTANSVETEKIAALFFAELETIHALLKQDIRALLEGDPAAVDEQEIIQSYPGFFAIAAYRIAHSLHRLGIKRIPRILTEYAHGKTGIDIHPGAKIGSSFFIDHGTGVVIGETTVIGEKVKIYQGVTLGALSVSKTLAATKRHPTIEDQVIIYAGATILGGNTVIGTHSVIGGNTWITTSIPANSTVFHSPTTIVKERKDGATH